MRRMVALWMFLAVASCGGSDSSTTPEPESITGMFSLITVNGGPLPVAIQNFQSTTSTLTVTKDVLTVMDGGKWTEAGTCTNQSGPSFDCLRAGTWIRLGSTFTFMTLDGKPVYEGTFTGNAYNLSAGAYAYVFSR